MHGIIVDLIQTIAAGVIATTGRHTAQDTSAASSKPAATTMAAGDATATEIGMAIAGSMAWAVEAMAEMALARRGSTDIRTESTMARVTAAVATAIVRPRTAITNTPTVAIAQATATKITTSKLTARRTRMDINRATTAAVAGAGTNSTEIKRSCGVNRMAFFYFGENLGTMPADSCLRFTAISF